MNKEQDNAAVIRDYYRAMGEGDFAHVVSLHDPDVVCWMSGTSLVSGRFEGRDALYAHMGEHVLGPLVVGTEPYVKGSRVVLVDGDYAVGLLHGGLPARDGGRYDQYYLQIFRFENGLIREIVEFFDTVMVEAALMKNHLRDPRPRPAAPFGIAPPFCGEDAATGAARGLAHRLGEALAAGDFGSVAGLLSPDAQIRVVGSTPDSGNARAPDVLPSIFGRGFASWRPVAADENAAVLVARDPTGQQFGLLIEVCGASIVCLSVFFDTVHHELEKYANRLAPSRSTSRMQPFDVTLAFTVPPTA